MFNTTNQHTENLDGFSDTAKSELDKICLEYRQHIISESRKIEQRERTESNKVEIIATHVREAKRSYRRETPKKIGKIVLFVILDLLIFVLGFVFDKDKLLKDNTQFIFFVIILFITIVLSVVKYAGEV